METEKAYRIFDRYMYLNRKSYNKEFFLDDDMYFAKTFRSHYYGFAMICKQYNVQQAYQILCTRFEQYEHKLLQLKYQTKSITEEEYLTQNRSIHKFSKYCL